MSRWVHPAWKALGIAPTSDTRAIRVAYSAKLKSIDPEEDPKGFIALREAFEAAKVQAQWVDLPDDEDDDDWDEDGQEWPPEDDRYQIRPEAAAAEPAPHEEPARRSPWAPLTKEDADEHSRALATLLYSHDRKVQPWPTDAQESEMLAHWRVITADPRMQEVSYFADAERWFSELIARTAAFSDPLVIPATEYFGWTGSDGEITQSPAIAYVTRRYKMLEFQRAVKQPNHPLNPAWRELIRPVGNRDRRGRVNKAKVKELLTTVRRHYPDLEGCFDMERVALWDGSHMGTGTGSGGDWSSYYWIAGLILFVALRFFATLGHDPTITPALTPPPIVAEYSLNDKNADIAAAIDTAFGKDKLSLDAIRVRNPALATALGDYWAKERLRYASHEEFAAGVEVFLTNWYARGLSRGSPDLLAGYHQLTIDMAKAVQRDAEACRRLVSSDPLWSDELKLPESFHERQKALVARAALEIDGSSQRKGGTFSIPNKVFDAAAARAHMSAGVLSAALLFKGSAANQCTGRIAFMESVLAMPAGKQRTDLMRVM